MPLYEYACEKCGKVFEVRQKFADEPLTVHEECGGKVDRLLSAPALHFKGSGFYITDYAKGSGGANPAPKGEGGKSHEGKAEGSSSESSKSDSGKSEGAKSKPDSSKSDSGSAGSSTPTPVTTSSSSDSKS